MSQQCDVLIIGGGATGAGTALDLALRGLKVIMVERADLGQGTTGRYHGLVHPGCRYVLRDTESAHECVVESRILHRVAAHTIEQNGGLWLVTAADDPAYADQWLPACHAAGIPVEEIPVAQALREEPNVTRTAQRAFHAPDFSLDPFDLLHSLALAIRQNGGEVCLHQEVVGLDVRQGAVTGARVRHARTGEEETIVASMVVNAAGAWCGKLAAMAGCEVTLKPNRGCLVSTASRPVHRVISRCHPPGDGDCIVPVGTVTIIGTTSVNVDDPDDTTVEPWEVKQMLESADRLVPGYSRMRHLRTWSGCRPLYQEKGSAAEGRELKRTFTVLDHKERDGVGGLVTITSGKLTTYRLMAERTADIVAKHLGVTKACQTAEYVLPDAMEESAAPRMHWLGQRLGRLEGAREKAGLICECEMVTREQIEAAGRAHCDVKAPWVLDDIRRDLRLGMGPCQGGFCGYRAAGILHEAKLVDAGEATRALGNFVGRRWKGQRLLAYGQGLRQALLDEQIYRGILGLDQLEES